MERWLEYKHIEPGQRIETFLQSQGYSRQNIVELKKMPESILINGKWEYMNHVLQEGEELRVHLQETDSSEKVEPNAIPLDIVYEDGDILVVNKPANMPVHPSQNHFHGTLANAVAYYYEQQGIHYVFRCINRLDRDTTGLVVMAKHMISGAILGSEMVNRRMKREYLAIVVGDDIEDSGIIDRPITRKTDSLIERIVSNDGQNAVTHYRVLERKEGFALITLHLDTGRTHQIRVHMKSIGHPLIGDDLYASEYMYIARQALHSAKLEFMHPITKEIMTFEQDLPEDMKNFWMNR